MGIFSSGGIGTEDFMAGKQEVAFCFHTGDEARSAVMGIRRRFVRSSAILEPLASAQNYILYIITYPPPLSLSPKRGIY